MFTLEDPNLEDANMSMFQESRFYIQKSWKLALQLFNLHAYFFLKGGKEVIKNEKVFLIRTVAVLNSKAIGISLSLS